MSFKKFQTVMWILMLMVSTMAAIQSFSIEETPLPVTNVNWNGFAPSTNGVVYAIAYDGNGNVYVGGEFTQVGGIPANNIAKWEISTASWKAIDGGSGGDGVNGAVKALLYDSSKNILYVGGYFSYAGGMPANCIAKCDFSSGISWSSLGDGMGNDFDIVNALAFDGTNLYAGGYFADAGDVTGVNNIAKWDGSEWSALKMGLNDEVNALSFNSDDQILYVGGWFTAAGNDVADDVPANYIAQCDISSTPVWSAIGTGTNGTVNALYYYYDFSYPVGCLQIGGSFSIANGKSVKNIVEYDLDNEWYDLKGGVNNVVNSIYVDDKPDIPVIYVGGQFTAAGGVTANHIASFSWGDMMEPSQWSTLGSGTGDAVNVIASDDDFGILYLGGNFTTAGGKPSNYLAKCATDGNYTVSDAPVSVSAFTKGRSPSATVSFSELSPSRYLPVLSYTATSSPGGFTADNTSSPITVKGLTFGKAYTFTVKAINPLGVGPASAASKPVTPITVPGKPTISKVTVSGLQATVTFTPPIFNGGTPVTSYTVYAATGGMGDASGTKSPITVTDLASGTDYTFVVIATNAVGQGDPSDESSSIKTPVVVPPGAPTAVKATAGILQATVSFTPPTNNGGSPIIGYSVTSDPAGPPAMGSTSPMTISGLTGGTKYTFTVSAMTAAGSGDASAPSNEVTLATIEAPGAPTAVKAVAGVLQATVSFTAPKVNGGAPITGYTVTTDHMDGIMVTGKTSPITVTGLKYNEPYKFTIWATNAMGTGPWTESNSVTIKGAVPGAPTNVAAIRGNGQATVNFNLPIYTGGAPITGYNVISGGKILITQSTRPIIVPNLTNGKAYTFTVTATNDVGTGPASAASKAVTPATVPGKPTAVKAVAGNGQATVLFTAPASNGGSPITSYTVFSIPENKVAVGAKSPLTVTGLTNGTPYTFTVMAENAMGPGDVSDESNLVTPMAKIANPAITGVTVPAAGDSPTIADDTAEYTAATAWEPAFGQFTPNNVYTATITLNPNRGYTLTGVPANFFKVAGATTTNLAGSGIVKAVFPKTEKTVAFGPIPGVTVPVTGVISKTSLTATTYTGTISWEPALVDGKFAAVTQYTATITLTPKAGYTFIGMGAGPWFTVAGTSVPATNDVGVVTAIFPETLAVPVTAIGAIIGTGKVNNVLTAGALTPSGAAATATYRWKRAGTATGTYNYIDGATSNQYKLGGDDVGKFIKVEATCNGSYSGKPLSAATGPIKATVPDKPVIQSLSRGSGHVTIQMDPVFDGGSPVTLWTATANPGGNTGTSTTSEITVSGLTNGTEYTFTVTAKNAVGTSPASTASKQVIPGVVPPQIPK